MSEDAKGGHRGLTQDVFNVPNILTMGRIALIPFIVLCLELSADASSPQDIAASHLYCMIATILFSIAAATDWFDGFLARNMGWTSLLGKLLDPIADKLLVMATLVTLTALDRVPAWLVILLLFREIAITGLRSIASSEGLSLDVVRAGKLKTALQLCGLIGLLLHYPYDIDFVFVTLRTDFHATGLALVALSLAFSVFSAALYFRSFLRSIAEKYREV